jgi:two-component system chemotaxis response regulator CheY
MLASNQLRDDGGAAAEDGSRQFNALVVDDSAVIRMVIGKMLRMSGLPIGEIFQADGAAKALEQLDAHWIDFATVDINMEGISGDELVAQLRQNPDTATLPILMISSESSETRIRELEALGAKYLKKPFDAGQIRESVLNLLGIPDDC